MDVRRALTYLFRDPDWPRKLGMAMLLNLLPTALNGFRQLQNVGDFERLASDPIAAALWGAVVGLANVPLYGYVLRIVRDVAAGIDVPLPAWADAPGLLRDGIALWGLFQIWGLPGTLLGLNIGSSPGDPTPGLVVLGTFLLPIVSVVVVVVQPAAEARLAVTGSFAAGLDVGAVLGTVRRNRGGYLRLVLVTVVGVAIAIGAWFAVVWLAWRALGGAPGTLEIFSVALIPMWATTLPYLQFVLYHLIGQVYAAAMG